MKTKLIITLGCVLIGVHLHAELQEKLKGVALPDIKPVSLKPFAFLEIPANVEPSGLVKSRLWPDVYWAHNDSGDIPRIFAMHRDGRMCASEREGAAHGVHIPDAVIVDWEDITTDDKGNLIIGDFGNSKTNNRRDLCLYYVFEPHPTVGMTSVQHEIRRAKGAESFTISRSQP